MRYYTYKDLQLATQYFRAENKIGEGGFGSVYKVYFSDSLSMCVWIVLNYVLMC